MRCLAGAVAILGVSVLIAAAGETEKAGRDGDPAELIATLREFHVRFKIDADGYVSEVDCDKSSLFLRTVDFDYVSTDAVLEHVSKLSRLRKLRLKGLTFTDSGLALIKDLKTLEELHVCGSSGKPSRVTGAGLAHLAGLTNLRRLNLHSSGIGNAGLEHLKALTRLEFLRLGKTHVNDEGLAHLGELQNMRRLDLGATRITDAGLAHLSQMTKLQTLRLGGTEIKGSGFVHLRKLPELRALDLKDTSIGDDAMADLAGISKLVTLSVMHTKITDAGLMRLKPLENLKYVLLYGSNVTSDSVQEIQHTMPKTRFFRTSWNCALMGRALWFPTERALNQPTDPWGGSRKSDGRGDKKTEPGVPVRRDLTTEGTAEEKVQKKR